MSVLEPGATVGILGGGQLGRMLALSAARLGFDVAVFAPEADAPAMRVAAARYVAPYDHAMTLRDFARACDVITFEFENVPAQTAQTLADAGGVLRPNPRALAIAQDRAHEKDFLNEHGIATAPWLAVETLVGLQQGLDRIGVPAVLKTRRFGYDGKGQVLITRREDAAAAFERLGQAPGGLILEGFVRFASEASSVLARGLDGTMASYDLAHNVHRNHILAETRVPAQVSATLASQAATQACTIAQALDYVGVLAVEWFVGEDGELIANEIAPRVHNSGHWTEAACLTDQFTQHIRAIAGWPLGSPERTHDAVMENMLGPAIAGWPQHAQDQNALLHLYGKRDIVAGRKMGHVTRIYPKSTQ